MPKLTKTQQRRLAQEILSKSKKLWDHTGGRYGYPSSPCMTTKDYVAIEAIVSRVMKRIG